MKSWLIIFNVGSNTASKIAGTCGDNKAYTISTVNIPWDLYERTEK